MRRISVPLKVALGYIFVVFILGLSAWLVYGNTRSFISMNEAERTFMQRRNVADSLIYSFLEMNNNEHSVYFGIEGSWPAFDRSVTVTQNIADTLSTLVADSLLRVKIEQLVLLLERKRENTRTMMGVMSRSGGGTYLNSKLHNLHTGRDSLVIHPEGAELREKRETVYEVVKTKKNFFGRLADAFRKSRNDTVSVRSNRGTLKADSVKRSLNIGDTVAGVLAEIKKAEAEDRLERMADMDRSEKDMQLVGVQLAQRIDQLLKDIRTDAYLSVQASFERDVAERRAVMNKIILLSAVVLLSAVALLVNIRRDVQRDKEYSENLEKAKNRSEQLLQQRERLLLTITHDIKAPAASISGFIGLLGEYVDGGKPALYLKNIRNSAAHLLRLVGALLDYHQLEKGRVEVKNISFRPSQLVADCVDEMRPQADSKGLKLVCVTSDCGSSVCLGDAFRIRQILDNLLSNALKYTFVGEVRVTAGVSNGRLLLKVADTGQGMTPEESRRVFDAFTRLDGAQGIEGVGLGLSITRELVSLLGGNVSLKSVKGQGTTFFVTLPVEVSQTADEPAEQPVAKEVPVLPPCESLNIIIIDDDKLQLQLLTEMLSRLSGGKWRLTVCHRIAEVRRQLASSKFDILITDIEMPEMNGADFIRSIDRTHMAVVAMTAHDKGARPQLEEAGFDACLFKPFDMDTLAGVIMSVTGRKVDTATAGPKADEGRFASLTAFAAGDEEAEREILTSFYGELTTHEDALRAAAEGCDRKAAARVSHKALPVLTMIKADVVAELDRLSAAKVDSLSEQDFKECCSAAIEGMEKIRLELEALLRSEA